MPMMSTNLHTPLTSLSNTASQKPSVLAFKIPEIDFATGEVIKWTGISFAEFAKDVDLAGQTWDTTLRVREGIPKGSVIALCLGGFSYLDIVHIYGIARAGFIPHLMGRLPGLVIVKELLRESETKALIRSVQFKETLGSVQDEGIVPVYDPVDLATLRSQDSTLPALHESNDPDDVFIIAHTSGSTSGKPKLVRCTFRWMDACYRKGTYWENTGVEPEVQNWMWVIDSTTSLASSLTDEFSPRGNICHMGQFQVTLINMARGYCTIQPRNPQNPFDLEELMDLIRRASLNALFLFFPLIIKLFHLARANREVLDLLKGLRTVSGSGAAFPKTEEEWVQSVGINVRGAFASTEIGLALATLGTRKDSTGAYYPVDAPGVSYRFDPVPGQENLVELVVLSDSIDCPRAELRSKEDGHFHTGDLWEEVDVGGEKKGYWYRGRDDDWIKCEYALRCDTKAIQDNVRRTCSDLIFDCVAVGYGRPSPTLIVEPAIESDGKMSSDALKQEIFERISPFNSLHRAHEKIASPELILIVAKNTLPRTETKGNIKRAAVEEMFKKELDQVYANSS
ncbi:hypothetical protein PM082_015546 [Marasmius tenuissimus]|nr:hypothetical protein PM082_015546 [Marasmius tenuissimus]